MVRPEFFIPFVFTLAAVFYALLGLYAWRRRPAVAVSSFAWVMLSMSVWSLTYGLEIFFPLLSTKLWIVNFEYIGIVGAPIFLFFFAMDYTGRNHLVTRSIRAGTLAIYILILLLIWTNPLHHLMWDAESIKQVGTLRLLNVRFGFAFWLHILFSYGLITSASIILIMDFLQRPGTLRLYISLVIIGILFSLFGTSAFALGFSPIPGIDFAPLFFLPTAIGLAWVTLQYRLSEILSLEHISVLKNMTDSVIVLNDQKRILYINPVTENLLKRTEDEVIGQPFHMVAGAFAETLDMYLTGEEYHTEIQIGEADEAKTYEAAMSSISSASRDTNEIVISLRDVTKRKEKEQELRRRDLIMSAISRAAEQFLAASDWEENIADVLENLGLAADASRVYVVVNVRDDHGVIYSSLKYEWAAFNVVSHMDDPNHQRVPLAEAGFERWIAALRARKPIFGLVKDFPEKEAEFLRRWDSLAIAALPIFVDQQWWGFIVFDETRHERHWNNMEVSAFQTAANIFGAAESQSRTARALVRRQMAMVLLHDIVTAALQAGNMRDMAEIVANRLAQLIQADGCFLTLWDDINKQTIPFAAYGAQKQAYTEIEVEPGEITFTRSALEMERTLIIEDTSNTPYASPSITRSFPSKSVLVLPLIAMEKKLGAVLVSFDNDHHFEFDEIQ
ncbi:MAG: GAF domain-containing protein, partial [Burkholderiales bacterium]